MGTGPLRECAGLGAEEGGCLRERRFSWERCFSCGPRIPFSFVPQADSGVMQVNLRLPPGTPIDVTNEATGRLEAWLSRQPEVLTVQTTVGSIGTASFGTNSNVGGHDDPADARRQRRNVFLLARDFRREPPAACSAICPPPVFPQARRAGCRGRGHGSPSPLSSSDFNALSDANQKVLRSSWRDRYVADVSSDSLGHDARERLSFPTPTSSTARGSVPARLPMRCRPTRPERRPRWSSSAESATPSSSRWIPPRSPVRSRF